jgi:conjugative transfer signal peptidase TraF
MSNPDIGFSFINNHKNLVNNFTDIFVIRGIAMYISKKVKGVILLCIGVCIALVLTETIRLPTLFIFNRTASLPLGFYIVIPKKSYQVGDIVAFDCPQPFDGLAVERGWIKKDELMLKKIGGVHGDIYKALDNHQFWINQKYIGQIIDKDKNNQDMPSIGIGNFTVKENNFLPIGENPRSFDGRYFGQVSLASIRYSVYPLVTWY